MKSGGGPDLKNPSGDPRTGKDSTSEQTSLIPLSQPAEPAQNQKIEEPTLAADSVDSLNSFQSTNPVIITSSTSSLESSANSTDAKESPPNNLNVDSQTDNVGILELSIENAPIVDQVNEPNALSRHSNIRNVWLWRSISMIAVLVVSALLLAYDFIFANTFQSLSNVTSYFPWAWQVVIYDSSSVSVLFFVDFAVSLTLLSVSIVLLLAYFVPGLKKSFKNENERKDSVARPFALRLKGRM